MCVSTHVCACVHQADCTTIFSVNSLGQAVPLEGRERGCVSAQATQAESTLGSRGLKFFSDSRVETNMAKKHQF